jgi:hypothetical protein
MTPDDAARIHQVSHVLAAGGEPAAALRHVLRLALGPLPLPRVAPAPLEPGPDDEPDDERQLRQFAQRFPAVMRGWFR